MGILMKIAVVVIGIISVFVPFVSIYKICTLSFELSSFFIYLIFGGIFYAIYRSSLSEEKKETITRSHLIIAFIWCFPIGFYLLWKKLKGKKKKINLLEALNIDESNIKLTTTEPEVKKVSPSEVDSDYKICRILKGIGNGIILSKNPDDYCRWFEYELGIKDPYAKICELRDSGYLINGTVETALKKMTVFDLKKELARQDLPVSGRKADLILRLVENGKFTPGFIPEVVELSEKGKIFLNEKSEFLFEKSLLDKYRITYDQYSSYKNKMPNENIYTILIKILYEQDRILAERNDIGMSRSKKGEISRAFEEQGDKKMALQYRILEAYYEMCEIQWVTDANFDYEIDGFTALKIHELKDYYSPTMLEHCFQCKIGGHYKAPDKKKFTKEINKIIE